MNRLRMLRKEKKLTQLKLSLDIHVSQQYISNVENNATSLTEDLVLRLCNYFHVSAAYLLGETDDRHSEYIPNNRDPKLDEWIEMYHKLNKENYATLMALTDYLINVQQKE